MRIGNLAFLIMFLIVMSTGTAYSCQGMCGDPNFDGNVNVSDAVYIINYVFIGGDPPQPVLACGNANNDSSVGVSDAVYIINFVFVGGNSPGDCLKHGGSWPNDDCCPFVSDTYFNDTYFPLEMGNQWVYSSIGDDLIWTVTQRQGNIVKLSLGNYNDTVTLRDFGNEVEIELADASWGLFYQFLPESIWVHRDYWDCNDSTIVKVFTEIDPIVTPAGVFENCLRIERIGLEPCIDAGTYVEWWALNVGLVKSQINTIAGPAFIELQEYTVVAK